MTIRQWFAKQKSAKEVRSPPRPSAVSGQRVRTLIGVVGTSNSAR